VRICYSLGKTNEVPGTTSACSSKRSRPEEKIIIWSLLDGMILKHEGEKMDDGEERLKRGAEMHLSPFRLCLIAAAFALSVLLVILVPTERRSRDRELMDALTRFEACQNVIVDCAPGPCKFDIYQGCRNVYLSEQDRIHRQYWLLRLLRIG
jgi:hypothetical protein